MSDQDASSTKAPQALGRRDAHIFWLADALHLEWDAAKELVERVTNRQPDPCDDVCPDCGAQWPGARLLGYKMWTPQSMSPTL